MTSPITGAQALFSATKLSESSRSPDRITREGQPAVRADQHPASEKAKQVAEEFESLFLGMMLKSMRQTATPEGESNARNIYTSMLDSEYAKEMAQNRSFGIKELILDWIARNSTHTPDTTATNPPPESAIPKNINPTEIRAKMAADSYLIQSKLPTK